MVPASVRKGIPNRTPGQSAARPQRLAKAPSHMTCPVNVSLSGGYPDGRTRRRGQEPAEPPQVRGISVGFSASTTGTPKGSVRAGGREAGPVRQTCPYAFRPQRTAQEPRSALMIDGIAAKTAASVVNTAAITAGVVPLRRTTMNPASPITARVTSTPGDNHVQVTGSRDLVSGRWEQGAQPLGLLRCQFASGGLDCPDVGVEGDVGVNSLPGARFIPMRIGELAREWAAHDDNSSESSPGAYPDACSPYRTGVHLKDMLVATTTHSPTPR